MRVSFKRVIDTVTLGSDRPIRRLLAYYLILGGVVAALLYFVPVVQQLFSGERLEELTQAPQVLEDGLTGGQFRAPALELPSSVKLAITTALSLVATLALMLPVTWVYMSARRTKRHNQAVAETLIILPIVVAAIVLIVRNSLALAFSLAGVVAAVRFRTTLRDTRDTVFIFLAIGVGFAAGVQVITVGAIASVIFNLVLLFTWRYEFGRNALEPTAGSQTWAEPLKLLADNGNGNGSGGVHDRDLVLALTPQKVDALADRFNRVREIVGTKKKKPRYNALVSLTTDDPATIQPLAEATLDRFTKRWKLDELVTASPRRATRSWRRSGPCSAKSCWPVTSSSATRWKKRPRKRCRDRRPSAPRSLLRGSAGGVRGVRRVSSRGCGEGSPVRHCGAREA
jgi:hypothetical protein